MIYDLIIIGGGPGGYNAALRAAGSGLSVLLFEKDKIGGVCLNEGCIPSKALLYGAKIIDGVKNGVKYGITGDARIDQGKAIDRKQKVVRTLTAGIKSALKSKGVEVVAEAAVLTGKKDGVFSVASAGGGYFSKNIIIASGSSAIIPQVPGADEAVARGFALTSREILDLREIPQNLIVTGGGVIGLEMASYFNSAGARVSVIEMLPAIGGAIDGGIAAVLQKNYERKGVTFHLSSRLVGISGSTAIFENADGEQKIEADKLLFSVGRRANTAGLGLDELGVIYTKTGITTDERCRTNIEGLYAVGDVNGKIMLAHTAYREGEAAVNDILGKEDRVDYGVIPSVIYTDPEIAVVGATVEEASAKGIDCVEKTISMRFSGRYLAENEGGDGICKLVVDKNNIILGVHMAGSYSSEIIFAAGLFIQNKMTADDIKKIIFPHPTVAEILREAAFEI